MTEMTTDDLFRKLYGEGGTTQQRGKRFERFTKQWLVTDPTQNKRFKEVIAWDDWGGRTGHDVGIDLIGIERGGGVCAIQCKFYDPTNPLNKAHIDSFLSASGKYPFTSRLVVSTSDLWGSNAKLMLTGQQIPVTVLGLADMLKGGVDWNSYDPANPDLFPLKEGKTPRPDQAEAIGVVTAGLETADRGQMVMADGDEAVYAALQVAEQLTATSHVLFLTNSLTRLSQALWEWTADTKLPMRVFAVCGNARGTRAAPHIVDDIDAIDLPMPPTTNPVELAKALSRPVEGMSVVFATYQAVGIVHQAQQLGAPSFDLLVADQAHRTTRTAKDGETSTFTLVHDNNYLQAHKRLYLPAPTLGNAATTAPLGPVLYQHPLSEAPPTATPLPSRQATPPVPPAIPPHSQTRKPRATPSFSDADNAELLVSEYGDTIRYLTDAKRWAYWDEHVWRMCNTGAGQIVSRAVDAIRERVMEEPRRSRSLNVGRLNAMVALARGNSEVTISIGDLDAHPYELNTPGGIVDLRTGQIAPTDPGKLHARVTAVTPDFDQPTPRWERFLQETFAGQPELIPYVQRLVGYSITGLISTQIITVLLGPTTTGKSVFMGALVRVLNDYASFALIGSGFLTSSRPLPTDEAALLKGVRLFVAPEAVKGTRFDEAKIDALTGGRELAGHINRGGHFDFTPTHKIWVLATHKPQAGANDQRLRIIPFNNPVPFAKQVGNLTDLLVSEEGPGILAWAVTGAVEFLTKGEQPAAGTTQQDRQRTDAFGRFVTDTLITDLEDNSRVSYAQMRDTYKTWCATNNTQPLTQNAFTRELKRRFHVDTGNSHRLGRYYSGVALKHNPNHKHPTPNP